MTDLVVDPGSMGRDTVTTNRSIILVNTGVIEMGLQSASRFGVVRYRFDAGSFPLLRDCSRSC